MTNDRDKFVFQPTMTITVIITSNYGIMNMKTISAVDAKTRFGQFIDAAQCEPVVVTKKNRPVGVFFSIGDIQDTIWGEEAKAADAEDYLTAEESAGRINALLDADD